MTLRLGFVMKGDEKFLARIIKLFGDEKNAKELQKYNFI